MKYGIVVGRFALGALALVLLAFVLFTHLHPALTLALLGAAGFTMLGPYTLITTCAAIDFGSRRAAASATGSAPSW